MRRLYDLKIVVEHMIKYYNNQYKITLVYADPDSTYGKYKLLLQGNSQGNGTGSPILVIINTVLFDIACSKGIGTSVLL